MPPNVYLCRCTRSECVASIADVEYGTAIVEAFSPLLCVTCGAELSVGLKIPRTDQSKLEFLLRSSRGRIRGAFNHQDYRQRQVQAGRPTDRSGLAPTPRDAQTLVLVAAWLRHDGDFAAFSSYITDAAAGGGLSVARELEVAYGRRTEIDPAQDLRSQLFANMPEFRSFAGRAKAETKGGEDLSSALNGSELFRFLRRPGPCLLHVPGVEGHTLGVIHHGATYALFDPCFGQFDFGSLDQLSRFLRTHLKQFYPRVTGSWIAIRLFRQSTAVSAERIAAKG